LDQVFFVESNLTGYGTKALQMAQARGLHTHFVAREPGEYEALTPNPVALADAVSQVDSYDIAKLLHFFVRRKPSGVLAFDDYRLIPAAIVSQSLGLPHASVDGLVNTHFKDRTRQCTAGVGGSVRAVVLPLDEAGDSAPLDYPCVVKPIDDSGSTGVVICSSDSEYRAGVAQIRTRPVNLRSYRCAPYILVEQYIGGEEFTAELAWDNRHDQWRLLGFTKKLMAEPPYRVELGAMFPHSFGPDLDATVEKVVLRWLEATGHQRGAAHVEFKVVNGQPVLMEINPRLGGDQIRELMLLTRGVDSVELYLDLNLGLPTELPETFAHDGYATSLYLPPPRRGIIDRITPPSGDAPGVVRHALAKRFEASGTNRDNDDRLGYVITKAATFDGAYDSARAFLDSVRLEYRD
jgi:biotin carboxylase